MLIGQFSYATVPEPGPYSDADGWKVQQVRRSGTGGGPGSAVDPDDEEIRSWIEKATESLGGFMPEPLPLLASRADIEALPRRLRLESYTGRRAALLHQVSVGQSHHGRDASFTHGLLVSCTDGRGIDGVRPAELWSSPSWVRPAGAPEVSAARLPADFSVDPAESGGVEELWSSHRGLALLLLSVLENAFTGGAGSIGAAAPSAGNSAVAGPTRLALVDGFGATTARWVAFLSRHLPAGAAWQHLTFSTLERAVDANVLALGGIRIIGISQEEAAGARRALGPDWLVVDPADPVAVPEDPAQGWVLPKGGRVPFGPWAQLAERLTLLDEMGMSSLTDLVDRVAGWCGGSADDRPLWALPAGLLTADPEVLELMQQVAPDAAELLQRQWPPGLRVSADHEAQLIAALNRYSKSPTGAFEDILRSAERTANEASGSVDFALGGYLRSLWGLDAQQRPPAWVASIGPLPWLPTGVRPSAALAESLLAGLSALVGWVWRLGAVSEEPRPELEADRTIALSESTFISQTRLLSCVFEVMARWGMAGRPPVSTEIAEHLVGSMVATIRSGTPVAAGSWPKLRASVFDAVRLSLQTQLLADPQATLSAPVLRWLDQQCGPLDLRKPLQDWTLLDLERVGRLPAQQGTGAWVIAAAGLLRAAVRQVPGREWTAAGWLEAMHRSFGTVEQRTVRGFFDVLIDRKVAVPVLAVGESLLAAVPLGKDAHDFAQWLASPRVTGSASLQPFGRSDLAGFPAVSAHASCRVEPPLSGELSGDSEFLRELRALFRNARFTRNPLLESLMVRLGVDILLVDSSFVVGGHWPWLPDRTVGGLDRDLQRRWEQAFGYLEQASVGRTAQRLALAGSLFVRALLSDVVGELRAVAGRYSDPAGNWLTGLVDPQRPEWRVEAVVKQLLEGSDRSLRQQWVADVRQDAVAAAITLSGRGSSPGQAVSVSPLVEQMAQLVDDNAGTLALGALGSRLPFSRPRPRRPEDSGDLRF